MYSASGFRITAPAQLHVTDALVYTEPPTAPAPQITAPAQPHATDAVATALLWEIAVNPPFNRCVLHYFSSFEETDTPAQPLMLVPKSTTMTFSGWIPDFGRFLMIKNKAKS